MANNWQANYWGNGSPTYNSDHSGYDKDTGYCELVSLGQMIAGQFGGKDNVTCLRFACIDANYSKLHFYINNYSSYSGQGTVKILVRTSELSSVTKSALEALGSVTREYTCVNSTTGYSELNEFDLTYNFVKGNIYYIYIWGKNSDTWRFRWYPPDNTFSGFAVTYTIATYTLTLEKGEGVESFTGAGTYTWNTKASTTAKASTGYHLTYYEGTSQDGGDTLYTWTYCANQKEYTQSWGIRADRWIKVYAEKDTFTLTLNKGEGVASFEAATPGPYEYNSSVVATAVAEDGYLLSYYEGTSQNGGDELYQWNFCNNLKRHTQVDGWGIRANRTLTVYAKKAPILTINQDTGTEIIVNRKSSPNGEGRIGILSNGESIYYNDELEITISAKEGYKITTQSHSNGTIVVGEQNIVVSATAKVLSYNLSISQGDKTTITVERTESPLQKAFTGKLNNGATIYYSDTLKITFLVSPGYELIKHTVNGNTFTSGNTHKVTKAVSVISASKPMGLIHIYDGNNWKSYMVYIYVDNTKKWKQHIPYLYDNGWKLGG